MFTLGVSPMSRNLFLSLISVSILLFSTNASANLNNLFGSGDLLGGADLSNLFNPSANTILGNINVKTRINDSTFLRFFK